MDAMSVPPFLEQSPKSRAHTAPILVPSQQGSLLRPLEPRDQNLTLIKEKDEGIGFLSDRTLGKWKFPLF